MTRQRRRSLAMAATLLAGALLLAGWTVARARCFVLVGQVTCRVETSERLVALSFDDGPTDRGVDAVLPVLAAEGARATFFVIGREVARRPALVRRIVAAGHEVGNHSFTHQQMVARRGAFYRDEIARTRAAIVAAGAPVPTLFRPPYGKKLWGLPLAARAERHRLVTWDVEDPATRDPAAFARGVVAQARPGSIILLHPMYAGNAAARAALPLIVRGLRARGYRIVTVGALLDGET